MSEKGPPLRLLFLTSLDATTLPFLFFVSVPCVRADLGKMFHELGWKRHDLDGYHRHQSRTENREPSSTTLLSDIWRLTIHSRHLSHLPIYARHNPERMTEEDDMSLDLDGNTLDGYQPVQSLHLSTSSPDHRTLFSRVHFIHTETVI